MRAIVLIVAVFAVHVDCQFWKYPQDLLGGFSWLRQSKTVQETPTSTEASNATEARTWGTSKQTTTAGTDATTLVDSTTQEVTGTTEEPRDNHRVHDFYLSKREKPQVKIASNISQVRSSHDFALFGLLVDEDT